MYWGNSQFEDGQVGEEVIFLAANLVVEVVLENANVGRVVSVWKDKIDKVSLETRPLRIPTPDTRSSIGSGRVEGFIHCVAIL